MKKLITIVSFQIGVNIIGLPEFHHHTKTSDKVALNYEKPRIRFIPGSKRSAWPHLLKY